MRLLQSKVNTKTLQCKLKPINRLLILTPWWVKLRFQKKCQPNIWFRYKERWTVAPAHHTEVTASCSELLSLHCPRHPLFLALLPACDITRVIIRQETSAYAEEPLRTVGLLEAAHQYSLQDMHRSACTPVHLYSLLRNDSSRTYNQVARCFGAYLLAPGTGFSDATSPCNV